MRVNYAFLFCHKRVIKNRLNRSKIKHCWLISISTVAKDKKFIIGHIQTAFLAQEFCEVSFYNPFVDTHAWLIR